MRLVPLLFLMHASELVHLAALIAAHGARPEGARFALPGAGLRNYWLASKCRLDRWQRDLRTPRGHASVVLGPGRWQSLAPVIEECLLSEILTRVWTGFLVAYDRAGDSDEAEPIARSVLCGQLEVRQRALGLLLHTTGVPIADAVAVNQLRRKCERWTDLLLGYLSPRCDLSDLASDPQRLRDFAMDWQDTAAAANGPRWSLVLASLREAFPTSGEGRSPNCDLNERIAASILACFPTEAFDSTGLFHSLWMVRLRYAADSLVESLEARL